MNRRTARCFLFLLVALTTSACATAPVVTNMVPPLKDLILKGSDKTVKVAAVTGGEKTNPMGMSAIENDGFQEALIKTLESARMFKAVLTSPGADYELHAEIISQDLHPGLTITAILFVRYTLIETRSSSEAWADNVLSHYDAQLEEAFSGPERSVRANEGAVRDNLIRLVRKLSQVLRD